MRTRIDPVRKELYKKARMNGKSKTQALRDAGYAETTAKNRNTNKTSSLVEVSEREVIQALTDKEIVEKLRELLRLKLELERQAYDISLKDKTLTQDQRLKLMNKTKDNIESILKTLRLSEGQSTENIQVDDQRQSRLNSMYDRLKQRAMN